MSLETVDDIERLLDVFPPTLCQAVLRESALHELLEVVLDLGRPPEARYVAKTADLAAESVDTETIAFVVGTHRRVQPRQPGRYSAYPAPYLRAPQPHGRHHRTDLPGRTGRVRNARYRAGSGAPAGQEHPALRPHQALAKPPCCARQLVCWPTRTANGVVIVDTSNEIAGDGDIPHTAIGRARRMQVPSPDRQHQVMIEAVENHMPEVIVVDEIGTEAEAGAARTIAERGVRLIATAHGGTLENLVLNPTLADLIGGVQSVTLGDDEARRRRTQKTVQERKAPPTFDVLIEIHTRHRFAVHPDVAAAVDGLLRGWSSSLEIRTRQEDGSITTEQLTETGSAVQDNTTTPTQGAQHRVLRIYPYGINRHRLEHAIHAARCPGSGCRPAHVRRCYSHSERPGQTSTKSAPFAGRTRHAALRLTERYGPRKWRNSSGIILVRNFLKIGLHWRKQKPACSGVIAQNEQCELSPQRARLRRLQHQVVKSYGLISHSEGEEPFRRLIVYPVGR